ncbi:MAG TPA: quinone-dependent dihydroorotate dehydrogenase [Baekduia sp.]|nr:quinone-dependent dihydroorotate dehydrogenase [Baekduia sp.]HMJ36616.1 quinone-dependent dihydroorotate dehydrogenase [Baekduia sp.]
MLFDRVLRRVDAETAHGWGTAALRLGLGTPLVRRAVRRVLAPRDPALRVRALGLDLPSPLGLAAGFDKDAAHVDALTALGFGFVEVGTVTALPQPGNARPRMVRLPADRALVNRMGFNNAGAEAAAARLSAPRDRTTIVGVNIGKTKRAPDAAADYRASAARLAPLADYLVINVSSPNTPGLRDLQAVDALRGLIATVREGMEQAQRTVPLLVKIAPDLADDDVDAIADLALATGLDGLVATNTTISRDGLRTDPAQVAAAGAGGLSGAPLADRSLAVLRRLRERVGDDLVLVSVGGVETPEDAWARLQAGATLVQAYTGFVYNGPLWPARMQRGLARLAREARSGSR